MKYNSSLDSIDATGSEVAYYAQFKAATPIVGLEYKTGKNTWQELTYLIVYVGHGVALGVCTGSKEMGNLPVGNKQLFHSDGYKAGWKYKDDRSVYRLQED